MKVLVKYLLIFVILTSCKQQEESVVAEVYKLKEGYGYKIVLQDKVLINQDCIPVIEGNAPFCDSLDAVKVSKRVIEKIKNKEMPTIHRTDLTMLKIKAKC